MIITVAIIYITYNTEFCLFIYILNIMLLFLHDIIKKHVNECKAADLI